MPYTCKEVAHALRMHQRRKSHFHSQNFFSAQFRFHMMFSSLSSFGLMLSPPGAFFAPFLGALPYHHSTAPSPGHPPFLPATSPPGPARTHTLARGQRRPEESPHYAGNGSNGVFPLVLSEKSKMAATAFCSLIGWRAIRGELSAKAGQRGGERRGSQPPRSVRGRGRSACSSCWLPSSAVAAVALLSLALALLVRGDECTN